MSKFSKTPLKSLLPSLSRKSSKAESDPAPVPPVPIDPIDEAIRLNSCDKETSLEVLGRLYDQILTSVKPGKEYNKDGVYFHKITAKECPLDEVKDRGENRSVELVWFCNCCKEDKSLQTDIRYYCNNQACVETERGGPENPVYFRCGECLPDVGVRKKGCMNNGVCSYAKEDTRMLYNGCARLELISTELPLAQKNFEWEKAHTKMKEKLAARALSLQAVSNSSPEAGGNSSSKSEEKSKGSIPGPPIGGKFTENFD